MPKNSKRIPPALKHGIFSGLGVLPTESRAKFHKFKKQRFADLGSAVRRRRILATRSFVWSGG
jgi:hypothetical protein